MAEPIVLVPPPAQAAPTANAVGPVATPDAGSATISHGLSTQRYRVALSRRLRIDGAAVPLRVDLLSERLLTFDLWLKPIRGLDDHLRVSSSLVGGQPQWQSYDVRVRGQAQGSVHAEGGSEEQRAFAEQLFGMLRALVPDRHSTEQLPVDATWSAQYDQALAYKGTKLSIRYQLKFRKLPMREVGNDTVSEVSIRGIVRSDPVVVQGHTLVGIGELAATSWLGPWEENAGAARMQLVLLDERGMQVGRVDDDIGYSALREDRGTDDVVAARAGFEAEHPDDCRRELFPLRSGTVRVTLASHDPAADRVEHKWDVDDKTLDRISAALIARRVELSACASDRRKQSGLALELGGRPFRISSPYNLTSTAAACVARIATASLEHLDLTTAHRIELALGPDRPDVDEDEPDPSLSMSKEQIRPVISSHIDSVRACYVRAREGWPELAGRVTVLFAIGSDGSVVFAVPRGPEVGPAGFACCVVEEVKSWRFPAPAEGLAHLIKYPFVFASAPE